MALLLSLAASPKSDWYLSRQSRRQKPEAVRSIDTRGLSECRQLVPKCSGAASAKLQRRQTFWQLCRCYGATI